MDILVAGGTSGIGKAIVEQMRGMDNRIFVISRNEPENRLEDVEFAICNRYQRWYYATPDKRFRITVDTALTFHHLGKLTNRFMPVCSGIPLPLI